MTEAGITVGGVATESKVPALRRAIAEQLGSRSEATVRATPGVRGQLLQPVIEAARDTALQTLWLESGEQRTPVAIARPPREGLKQFVHVDGLSGQPRLWSNAEQRAAFEQALEPGNEPSESATKQWLTAVCASRLCEIDVRVPREVTVAMLARTLAALNRATAELGKVRIELYSDDIPSQQSAGSASSGPAEIRGRLPPPLIQRIVRQSFHEFRKCYEQGLARNPTLQGRVVPRFVIGRDGKVSNVTDDGSDLPDEGVRDCVLKKFYELRFPAPEGGIVTVVYPIMLAPG